MSGLIRQHRFFEKDALDLRKIREAFYDTASRFRELYPEAFCDLAFDITRFESDAFEEMYGQFRTDIKYKTPQFSGLLIPASNFNLADDDAWLEAEVTWSISIKAASTSASWVAGWVVVGSQSLWNTLDFRQSDNPRYYTGGHGPPSIRSGDVFPNGELFSMGNIGCVVTINGHHPVGVMVLSEDDFEVDKIHVDIRKVLK
jgi:hypothetical protein